MLSLVIRDRGGYQNVLNGSSRSSTLSISHRGGAGGGEAITLCVVKALQALPLQTLHLAYESGPFPTYDVPACGPAERPSRVVVSSSAGLIITVTDGEGEVIEREAGCATGPVAHDL